MTIYELHGRRLKAERLANALVGAKINAELAREMDARNWESAAVVAGVRMPSEKTQALVIEILEERENAVCR